MKLSLNGLLFIGGGKLFAREKELSRKLKKKITQAQFDALMSLYFRTDGDDLWVIVNLINKGKIDEAGQHLLLTEQDEQGDQPEETQEKRIAEHILFQTGKYNIP